MPKSTSYSYRFRYTLIVLLTSIGMTSCANSPKIKSPPIITTINLSNPGLIADFQFEVQENLIYEYLLRFYFQENNQTDRNRVRKILGGHEIDKSGNAREPGTPTPIRLIITKIDQTPEVKIYFKEINPILTSWGGNSFSKNIGHCDLPPGKYRARLENLNQSNEFSLIPASFIIGMDKFKTTFNPNKSDKNKSCPQ